MKTVQDFHYDTTSLHNIHLNRHGQGKGGEGNHTRDYGDDKDGFILGL